ncbi:hypothetical protein CHRY9393_03441 [Chryseobacterium fistulae]|uniref:Uncharacterized protein n=1 Tax=Chryseobacterium fistulae TaxID=2675058 RepID=A0A6N4XV27_9FLAO|nr:hypothetical protein CHRY9393_03441 [Chryseobacterium fistulae]
MTFKKFIFVGYFDFVMNMNLFLSWTLLLILFLNKHQDKKNSFNKETVFFKMSIDPTKSDFPR